MFQTSDDNVSAMENVNKDGNYFYCHLSLVTFWMMLRNKIFLSLNSRNLSWIWTKKSETPTPAPLALSKNEQESDIIRARWRRTIESY